LNLFDIRGRHLLDCLFVGPLGTLFVLLALFVQFFSLLALALFLFRKSFELFLGLFMQPLLLLLSFLLLTLRFFC